MTESEKNIRIYNAEHRENNIWWFWHHGQATATTIGLLSTKCERDGNEWMEQEEMIRESTQAAWDVMASHNDKDGQEDAHNDNEPPSKKAKQ